ncbi:MAG: tRNA 2-thiouridine(34) synthase MnmA [Dehalococcoidales bacterium]|nr:tRNA 2-thiouridine(34) synthase MnmA [Dehalococcoidales bacterium]
MNKIVVAMSGGVDSSVTAALLKEAGYQVIGVTMQIWPSNKLPDENRFGGCCGIDAAADARKVAYQLGIPHYVMDFRDIFARKVIADFCQEYRRGRTPNPCIRCNQHIKFNALRDKARGLGTDFIATGHYARIEKDKATGTYLLKKGVDRDKDQSYFLYPVTQEQLSHTLFPLGDFTKKKVREIARDMTLPVATKSESQEICFIPDSDYPGLLKAFVPQAARPGLILDEAGNTLGRHQGILSYTTGQRRRLGISAREPLYVIAIEPAENAIVVGPREKVFGSEFTAANLNWLAILRLTKPTAVKARIRYQHQEAEAIVSPLDEYSVYVKFTEPQMAITPGQAVVFYDGDTVLGGGTIDPVRKEVM